MSTQENNKLIAEFMGIKFGTSYFWRPGSQVPLKPEHLKYHESMDWLMKVVSKILSSRNYCEFRLEKVSDNKDGCWTCSITHPFWKWQSGDHAIEAVYKSVVEFIKWYNENKEEL